MNCPLCGTSGIIHLSETPPAGCLWALQRRIANLEGPQRVRIFDGKIYVTFGDGSTKSWHLLDPNGDS